MAGCKDVKNHAEAFAMCKHVVRNYPNFDFDTGVSHNVSDKNDPLANPTLEFEKPNGTWEVAEIYKGVNLLVDMEEIANAETLKKCIDDPRCDTNKFSFKMPILDMAVSKGSMVFPRIFSDSNPKTVSDKNLFIKIVSKLKKVEEYLISMKIGRSSVTYQKSLSIWIYNYISKPINNGSFAVTFDSSQLDAEKSVSDVLSSRSASCAEFTNTYKSIGKLAGLDVRAVEIFYDSNPEGSRHLKPCVVLPNGKMMFFDLTDGYSYEEKEKWSFISDEDLTALDLTNRHQLNNDENQKRALGGKKSFMQMAYEMSPYHPPVLNAYFADQINTGADPSRAMDSLLRAIDENPFYAITYYNLSVAYGLMNNETLSDSFYKKFLDMTENNDHAAN